MSDSAGAKAREIASAIHLRICNCTLANECGREPWIADRIAAALVEYGESCQEAKDCSHCSGTLQSFQVKYHRGCLCRCHEGTYADADAEGYRRRNEEEKNKWGASRYEDGKKSGLKEGREMGIEEAAKMADTYATQRYSSDTQIEAENMAKEIRALLEWPR